MNRYYANITLLIENKQRTCAQAHEYTDREVCHSILYARYAGCKILYVQFDIVYQHLHNKKID